MTSKLKANSSWFAPTTSFVKREIIEIIRFEKNYSPKGWVVNSWDASEEQDGSIMVYIEGAKLTISAPGAVYANEDASYLFSDVDGVDFFSNVERIEGLDLLDTSLVKTFDGALDGLARVEGLDLFKFVLEEKTDVVGDEPTQKFVEENIDGASHASVDEVHEDFVDEDVNPRASTEDKNIEPVELIEPEDDTYVSIKSNILREIAEAIRYKSGLDVRLRPSEFAKAIRNL